MQKLVWYTCYGSNLLRERFLCYLKGGLIPGNTREERGAKNPSEPLADKPCFIPHRLYFALHAKKWDDLGVAFIDFEKDESAKTYGRSYLITEEQFFDVVRQENALPADAPISFDYDRLHREGSIILFPDNYYGRLMYLGEDEGYPCYTFTSIPPMKEQELVAPSDAYYKVIADGLKETHGLSDATIEEYMTM